MKIAIMVSIIVLLTAMLIYQTRPLKRILKDERRAKDTNKPPSSETQAFNAKLSQLRIELEVEYSNAAARQNTNNEYNPSGFMRGIKKAQSLVTDIFGGNEDEIHT